MNNKGVISMYYKQEFDDGNFLLIQSSKVIREGIEISKDEYTRLMDEIQSKYATEEKAEEAYNEQRLASLEED